MFIGNLARTQKDTNHLVIGYLELTLQDTNETLLFVKLINESDTLTFTNISDCKMTAINRWKTCDMVLKTNKTDFVFENINEYLSFPEAKYRIYIEIPLIHSNCINATIMQPDGLEMFHPQTMEHSKNEGEKIECMNISAAPTGYNQFEEFVYNFILD